MGTAPRCLYRYGNGSAPEVARMAREQVERLPKKAYEAELFRLQGELVKLQEWVRTEGARLVVVFEGRDAAGKGSTIKRVSEYLNPRLARIAALPAPTERERTQWYFQRYIQHFPAAGEIVLFDRSWYNRAGVERVMGFCSKEEYMRFLHQCPIFERLLIEEGILLRKYWFSVSDTAQEQRFRSRLQDPMRRWKLSPMDLQSISRWEEYSRAKDEMFLHTDIPEAPWYAVDSEDKRRARINMIAHLLSTLPYHEVQRVPLELPPRPASTGYQRIPREMQTLVPDHAATLLERPTGKPAGKASAKPAGKSGGKSAGKRSGTTAQAGKEERPVR
jgi:polyphosphate kinase